MTPQREIVAFKVIGKDQVVSGAKTAGSFGSRPICAPVQDAKPSKYIVPLNPERGGNRARDIAAVVQYSLPFVCRTVLAPGGRA
jgi:hypothetical protein